VITDRFIIYTDGAHKNQWGSWAFIVLQNNKVIHEASARCKKTDSLRMEIQAVLEALNYLSRELHTDLEIHTDCKILIENIKFLNQWQMYDWRKQNGALIPNVDLYQQLHNLIKNINIHWKWVRAHSQNLYNERCDELCREARRG
jgi:ribonuclease HI